MDTHARRVRRRRRPRVRWRWRRRRQDRISLRWRWGRRRRRRRQRHRWNDARVLRRWLVRRLRQQRVGGSGRGDGGSRLRWSWWQWLPGWERWFRGRWRVRWQRVLLSGRAGWTRWPRWWWRRRRRIRWRRGWTVDRGLSHRRREPFDLRRLHLYGGLGRRKRIRGGRWLRRQLRRWRRISAERIQRTGRWTRSDRTAALRLGQLGADAMNREPFGRVLTFAVSVSRARERVL